MNPSITWLDVVNIVLASAAAALAVVAVYLSSRQQRLAAFFQIQQFLLADDVQHGRKLLYEATRRGELPADPAEFALIIRALANFNAAAGFARRRIVSKRWLLESWHHGLRDMRVGYESVVAYRLRYWHDWTPFADLARLIEEAERYRAMLPCCDERRRGRVDRDPSALLTGGPPHEA
ncbi:MAG TPA: hypothetical protein VF062_09195 [Candidatus Limnocylindrales bacterium]